MVDLATWAFGSRWCRRQSGRTVERQLGPLRFGSFIRFGIPGEQWAAALLLGGDLLGDESMFTYVADLVRTKQAALESTGRSILIMTE